MSTNVDTVLFIITKDWNQPIMSFSGICTLTYPHGEMLHINNREQTVGKHYIDESQKYPEWKSGLRLC